MTTAAILLAAGRGERLGDRTPKGFVELAGRTLLEHALAALAGCGRVGGVVIVVPAGWEDRARELAAAAPNEAEVVAGGHTRQASVSEGLRTAVRRWDPERVICHDVARPLAPASLFDRVLDALAGAEGAIPAVPVTDTVKVVDDGRVTETLDRDRLAAAQTPQAFRTAELVEAHRRAEWHGVRATDDAALLERAGYRVDVVPGDPANLKLTGPEDLIAAAAILTSRG